MKPFSFCTIRFRNFPVWTSYSPTTMNTDTQSAKNCNQIRANMEHKCVRVSGRRGRGWLSTALHAFGFASLPMLAFPLQAQVAITANVPAYQYQVLAGSTRQINVNITGGKLNTVNWSVLSTTGGASATFTTPAGADVSAVSAALPTVQVNIGPTQGNCSISGTTKFTVSSTASVTVQAQSVDDPTKTAKFLFNVCANSPATLANGTSSVIVAPAYQQAYQSQPMTLQSWVTGCVDETGTWSIVSEPSGGNGTLMVLANRLIAVTISSNKLNYIPLSRGQGKKRTGAQFGLY